MSRPNDIKFAVLSNHPQEGGMEWFDNYTQAANYVRDTLIQVAEAQADERGYPDWIDNVMIVSILADVVSTPDGLQVERRV